MLDFELQTKLEDRLKKGGFEYDFSIDDNYYFDRSYGKYTSLTLKSITGLLNNSILNNDSEHSSYNIDLINRITKCLIDSNDIELKNIAWNSFIDCEYDERFILFDEMKKARDLYFDKLVNSYNTNHTKTLVSERLYIKPNNKEDGKKIYEYVNKFDKDEYLFARMARNSGAIDYFIFCLCLKETDEIVGNIGFTFYENQKNTFNFSYYIKKEHRGNRYIKEAFNVILDAIKRNEIVLYGQWNREYVLEETKPVIKLLRIEVAENNIASFNTAKSLGFEYEGKIVNYKKINGEDRFNLEHHFALRIGE